MAWFLENNCAAPRRDEKRDAAREVDKDSRWGSRCAVLIPRPLGGSICRPGSLV